MDTRTAFATGVRAEGLADGTRPSARYAAGRVCSLPGCRTVLSIYNEDDRCAQHSFLHVDVGNCRTGPKPFRTARRVVAR
jgi:hypothetical protein